MDCCKKWGWEKALYIEKIVAKNIVKQIKTGKEWVVEREKTKNVVNYMDLMRLSESKRWDLKNTRQSMKQCMDVVFKDEKETIYSEQ